MHYFVTSSGTDIGKTFITALLIRQLRRAGRGVSACKPVLSGFDAASPEASDTACLLEALGHPVNEETIHALSPYRFKAPLSPHMAAAMEDRPLRFDTLMQWCAARGGADIDFMEGVGGVMVPLNEHHTVLDWMMELNRPAILVVGSYLGSLSHSLTAAAAIRQVGIPLQAVIVSESAQSTVPLEQTVSSLRQFLPYARHILGVPRVKTWQEAPDLLHILA